MQPLIKLFKRDGRILQGSQFRPVFLIGIDEAGRGPLAGPVVVAGVRLKAKSLKLKAFKGIRDSKKLTAQKREEWFRFLTSHPKIEWAVASVRPEIIDQINIAQAVNLGVERVHKKLSRGVRSHAMLDGSMKLREGISHEVIIKGDEKVPLIAAASIIAKVTRDRLMHRLHKKYPQYGFDIHKGYATKLHRRNIKKYGSSKIHRKSFSFD